MIEKEREGAHSLHFSLHRCWTWQAKQTRYKLGWICRLSRGECATFSKERKNRIKKEEDILPCWSSLSQHLFLSFRRRLYRLCTFVFQERRRTFLEGKDKLDLNYFQDQPSIIELKHQKLDKRQFGLWFLSSPFADVNGRIFGCRWFHFDRISIQIM